MTCPPEMQVETHAPPAEIYVMGCNTCMHMSDNDGEARVTVRLDPELDGALEAEREQGPYTVPKAEVIRTALKEYLNEDSRQCPPA